MEEKEPGKRKSRKKKKKEKEQRASAKETVRVREWKRQNYIEERKCLHKLILQ